MPRGFSEQERATIRAGLLERARELLMSYGIKKTSVEDLTTAVGISKGAFYLFYQSKEELFFAVLQQFEADYQASLIDALGPASLAPRDRLLAFITRAITLWREQPLFRHFGREDYELLMRRLPDEQIAIALRNDDAFAVQLIERWAAEGITVRVEPRLLTGLMRALFYVVLHSDELPPDIAPAVIERMATMLATELVQP